jgi:uncharacterized protein (DUF1800 family)
MYHPQKALLICFFLTLVQCGGQVVRPPALVADDGRITHLLNRIGFGPSPGDLIKVRQIGMDNYIEQQLKPAALPRSARLDERLAALSTLDTPLVKLSEEFEPPKAEFNALSDAERKTVNQNKNRIVEELAQAKILRAVLSPAQLQEVMVDFWFNHFNVFAGKDADKIWISSYERDAIRPFVLGKFQDLLFATAKHPAMLFYLDNWQNAAPDSPGTRNKQPGINENYARELLELHTLGVNGGYTQQDVTTLAQILTGWGLTSGKELWRRAAFDFNPRRHDAGGKTLLGFQVGGTGQGAAEIETVLAKLARHPATARHVAYQLAQYFVADQPPESLVNKLSSVFLSSDGDIAVVLRNLFASTEFWDQKYTQNKFKPPFRYLVSSLRAANLPPPEDGKPLLGALRNMGEPLYFCLTPNGYANSQEPWLNPDALLKRIDFSRGWLRAAAGEAAAPTIKSSFGNLWSKNTLDTVADSNPGLKPVLLLNSPEFLYY